MLNTLIVILFSSVVMFADIHTTDMLNPQQFYTQHHKNIQYFGTLGDAIDGETKWKALAYTQNDKAFLALFKEDVLVYTYAHAFSWHHFIKATRFMPKEDTTWVASTWKNGVHGEAFVLLDPLHQKVLYSVSSTWQTEVCLLEKTIAVGIIDGTDKEGKPLAKIHTIHENLQIDIHPVTDISDDFCTQAKALNKESK